MIGLYEECAESKIRFCLNVLQYGSDFNGECQGFVVGRFRIGSAVQGLGMELTSGLKIEHFKF